jgi:hypothetical protein
LALLASADFELLRLHPRMHLHPQTDLACFDDDPRRREAAGVTCCRRKRRGSCLGVPAQRST